MTARRTPLGKEVEAALGEVLAHTRGENDLVHPSGISHPIGYAASGFPV